MHPEVNAEAAGEQSGRFPALLRCIAKDPGQYAKQHWGRTPLLTRHAELQRDLSDLFDRHAVDELVSRRGLRTPFLRMARDGNVIPAQRYTRGGGAGASIDDQVADDKVLALMADGATLVLQGLHRTWPPLVEFGSELSSELGHPVQINAYVTPPQNQGFAPHYDVHDVFVLQIAGRKRWRIHEPVIRDPLGDQPWEQFRDAVAARATEPPLIDEVLEPGDTLYLPRGYLHSAVALGEPTIHLTVGVHPYTRYQLAKHLLALAAQTRELRRTLPMGVDLSDPAVLGPELNETINALHSGFGESDLASISELVNRDLIRQTRPESLNPLDQLAIMATLAPDTPLKLRPGLRHQLKVAPTTITIQLVDKAIELPIASEAALKTALQGDAFTPAQLPGLDAGEQLVVARRLLHEGVLVPA